jgi:phage baseplate assembly protein W
LRGTVAGDRAFLGRGWSFPLEQDVTGEIALSAGEEDIREAVRLILETSLGERVMRPDFGAGLQRLVFEPLNTTTMALVRHRVEEALVTWEPRIDVDGVRVVPEGAVPNSLRIEVDYRVRATNTFYNLVYPFYLLEAELA